MDPYVALDLAYLFHSFSFFWWWLVALVIVIGRPPACGVRAFVRPGFLGHCEFPEASVDGPVVWPSAVAVQLARLPGTDLICSLLTWRLTRSHATEPSARQDIGYSLSTRVEADRICRGVGPGVWQMNARLE